MKCSGCSHIIAEKIGKFCSNCGKSLSAQFGNTQGNPPKSLETDVESKTEDSDSQKNVQPAENTDGKRSPKRQNEEPNSKKKKKKKRNKRKKDVNISDQEKSLSDLSHISVGDNQQQRRLRGDSSDSESSDTAMNKRRQDEFSSLETPPSSLVADNTVASSEETDVTQSENTGTVEAGVAAQSEEVTDGPKEGERDAQNSTQDQTIKTAPADTPDQPPTSENKTSQSAPGTGTEAANPKDAHPKDQKTACKNANNKEETDITKQPAVVQDANVDPNGKETGDLKQKGNLKDSHKQKEQGQQDQEQINSSSKAAISGSSVDPEKTNMEVQESASVQDTTSDDDKERKQDSQDNVPTPPLKRPTQNKTIAACERLTIYFHAVLSKDFKFDPDKDQIFIRAGTLIGTWEENAAELSVTRDLGEHGYLVEGRLTTSKSKAASKSIPYKYVVYKDKKQKYEYEYIYKINYSQHPTNRCLFVKSHLITKDGDWHQYDDIICAEPSKGVLKRFKEAFLIWPEEKRSLVEGRKIAGRIMLGTIFDLLRGWSETNLSSFQVQLNQFFQVYGNPFVFEDKEKKWDTLDFGEDDVRWMLKEFMLAKLIPQSKDGERQSSYIQDPFRAAVIMLHTVGQYKMRLDNADLTRLCTALCLPKLEKDTFLQYWTEFSQDVSVLKGLLETLVSLIKTVKHDPQWIMVLPLLHLLKGTSKPFEVQTSANMKYDVSWAGLQGLDMGNVTFMSSQNRKSLLNVIKNYSHLTEVDTLLVRSCLYLMPIDELMECTRIMNPELLDLLLVFTNKVSQETTASNFQDVTDILAHIQGHLLEEKYSYFTKAYGRECLATAVKLLEKICKGVRVGSYSQNFPDIPVACMNLVSSVSNFIQSNKQQEAPDGENQHGKGMEITEATRIMRNWMSQSFRQSLVSKGLISYFFDNTTKTEIEIWNNIISINFKHEEYTKEWRQTFTMDFEGKYKQESALNQVEYYCKNIEKLSESHPHVASIIEKCALEAVTSLCQSRSQGKVFEWLDINWKFGKLISAITQKSWPTDNQGHYQEDQEIVFQHLLSWTAAKEIFHLHDKDKKLTEKLSNDAGDRIAEAISSFKAITNQLLQGHIKISVLNNILQRQQPFLDLLKIECLSETGQYREMAKIKRLLQCRQDEVRSVYREVELVDVILTMCHKLEEHMTVDVADLENKKQVNIEMMPLDHFMEVHPFDQMASEKAGIVTYFNLSKDIKDMAEVLYTFRESYIFKLCWEEHARDLAPEEMEDEESVEQQEDFMVTPEVIHDNIFSACYDEYKDIYTHLKDGSIALEKVNQLFGAYKGKYDDLKQELDIMCKVDRSVEKRWIHGRVEQIEQYHELHLAVASAEVIMKVKETLGLHGDFGVLETLTEVIHADFQKEPLSRIDNNLMQAKMVLVDITEPRRRCLKELGLRRHFVKWVKDALEDINELKVFVDLASISAGENDMDVDRVACFHDAVLGYSSVLYELKPDSGFTAFKEVLKKLWRAFENDGNLPKKLRDSSCHLKWLKTVKDNYGSVQLSSLSLAPAIDKKHDSENVLDTTALLRSCVQSAVGMLRDQEESVSRSTRRVLILLTLLTDDNEITSEFLQTMKKHLHSLLESHDGNSFSSMKSYWVFKEASNIDALKEGGSLRNTLWKHLQAVVVPILAHLISIIDQDQNMNLLLDRNCCESVKRLWLDMFSNEKLLNISHLAIDRNSETRTILVQTHMIQDGKMGCSMPFSWRIKDHLEELLVHALQHEGQTQQEFVEFFWKTPLGRFIEKADPDMQTEFYQRYLQDFISMSMSVTCQEDLQLLRGALNCCVSELRLKLNDTETVISLPWVHSAYHEFKNRLQNLSRMMCLQPQVTKDLLGNKHASDSVEMVLDVYAAFACLEHLEPRVLDTDAQRQAWLRQVKKLQVPIELICSEDSVRNYGERSKMIVKRVQSGWNRIFSLSLFVEHMLLGIEVLERKLTPVVLEHTRGLGQILEKNSDLKTQQSFEAVIGLLKTCKDGAVERIFRFGLTICPVCMGDPQDPLSLGCEHIYCLACIKQWLIPGQMYCPLCMQPVADDFPMVPSDDIRIQVTQHAQFRKQCNAFFIDLVSTVCFKDNSPPSPAVIHDLLSFLMVEANAAPLIGGNPQTLTKVLSPFDDSVDRNPVVRSVVLKLLLKYSFDDVKEYLQQHLMEVQKSIILEDKDKTELYCLYINCLEDSMFERLQFRSIADKQAYVQDENAFLTDFLQTHDTSATNATVECLQQVARVRMDLDLTARIIVEKLRTAGSQEGQTGTRAFLETVVNLCRRSGNDWYRVYLIRKICSQHGVEFVLKLLKEDQMRWLFPEELVQHNEETTLIDQYLVYGEDYKTVREAVAKVIMDGKADGLEEACETCRCPPQNKTVYLLLALFREVTTLYKQANASFHPKPEQLEALTSYIQTSRVLASPEVKAFARALVTNELGPLTLHSRLSGSKSASVEITVHLAAVLLCGAQGILAPLQQLAMAPANMLAAFLPTMPEDMIAVAQQVLGPVRWYLCPNGHPCTIGECGQPMETSHCVDCGAVIGGNNHLAVQGFQGMGMQGDRTQSGHILGDAQRRDNPDMLDTKSISPVPFTVIRMLTHMAMLLGTCSHLQFISAIIKPQVADPGAFVLAHLGKDVEHLARSLGKGTDDTISAVHLLIGSLLGPQQPIQWPAPHANLLSTKEARNAWEVDMSNSIITPQLKNLERQLKEVNTFIRGDSRLSANPVVKLVFGDPRLFLNSLHPNSLIHCSAVWSCREKVSLLSLTHIVEQNDGRDALPVLWRFLQKEAEVRLVKHLPDILALQKDLIKKFQNITELTYKTIGQFLQNLKAASLKAWYKKYIKIFLSAWNRLRGSLATNGEIKIPDEFCQKDLDMNSDFRVLLPRRQGPGLCSTALVSYLITLHNDLVYSVDRLTGEETSYKVSPADLTDLHVIRYEIERDVMPLVLSNVQYSIKKGQETLYEYDLPRIQQQIISRFLLGKPLITLNGIPTLVNRHDRNYEIILRDVKEKVRQEPLQTLTLVSVAGELQSYSEVCEALSTLEVALGFLAMTGGEPEMQLSSYLEEVLQMGNQMAQHIVKALSMCCVKHCVALWQLLASLKSENMLCLKRDPFVGVSEKYKEPLSDEDQQLLIDFFSKNSADSFLLEMHEFLVLVLKTPNAPDTYRPNWGLKETLMPYMDQKDVDVPPDVEELFPEKICLSHYVEAWKFIVTFKKERGQRQ